MKNIDIATSSEEFNNICKYGCIICKKNKFNYIKEYNLYECNNCKSVYAIDKLGMEKLFCYNKVKKKVKNKTDT